MSGIEMDQGEKDNAEAQRARRNAEGGSNARASWGAAVLRPYMTVLEAKSESK